MYGLSDEEIFALLGSELEKFSVAEQALLRLADALVGAPVRRRKTSARAGTASSMSAATRSIARSRRSESVLERVQP
jgi:hypothetical protein